MLNLISKRVKLQPKSTLKAITTICILKKEPIMKRILLGACIICTFFSQAAIALSPPEKSPAQQHIEKIMANTDFGALLTGGQPPTQNWLAHGRTYDEQRYSPLDDINTHTVKNLGLAWHLELGSNRGLEASPIVVDGVMFFSGPWGQVFAVDARTGKKLWHNDLQVDKRRGLYACCDVVNRGVAAWEGKIFVGTTDGRLVALNAATGEIIWDRLTIDLNRPYAISGAPRIVKGKVIIGNGGAEYGVRGYVSAYDANSGEMVWRFYTVPGNPANGFESDTMEMAAKTWGGGPWWEVGGGGTVWDSMAYDAELDLFYIGVGNGSPWNNYIRSPAGGGNLFLSSIVALKPDTGEYVWHYQTTPGEGWDYTATQHMILADIEIDGKLRQVIMQAPKNGFFYVLDRLTGKLISANNYVPVTWATHIDPESGRPVETDNEYLEESQFQFPSPLGGHNWQPMCYHHQTGLVYIPSHEMGMVYAHDPDFEYIPMYWNIGLPVAKDVTFPTWLDPKLIQAIGPKALRGYLQAWDPVKQERVWQVNHQGPWNGGTLCTAGGLVFQGNSLGNLQALDAATGDTLWSFHAQHGIIAPPVTYSIDGEQYLSVLVGWGGVLGLSFSMGSVLPDAMHPTGRMLTFKLGEDSQLPPVQVKRPLPEPPNVTVSEEVLLRGNKAYHAQCVYCHGPGAISTPTLADLRYMSAETHDNFNQIVMNGTQLHKGMMGFSDVLSEQDVEDIHAYLAYLGQQALKRENQPKLIKQLKQTAYHLVGFFTSIGISLTTWWVNVGS